MKWIKGYDQPNDDDPSHKDDWLEIILTDFDKKGYYGQYKRIFHSLNKDNILWDGYYEAHESGQRDENGNYILRIKPEPHDIDGLLKIKGITILE